MRWPLFLALAVALLAATGATAAAAKSVAQLLEELRRTGVEVTYSSDLVPPTLVAEGAAADGDPLSAALRALAAVGLELRAIGNGRFVVTRASGPRRPSGDDAPAVADLPLAEVSVYASRYAMERPRTIEPDILTAVDIQSIPGSHDDALRSLRTLPGLATNASGRPYIRGSLANDVLIRFDGVTLVDPYHLKNFQSLISAIDPATVERIEIYSAGFPVRFGTRSGGVIDITGPSRDEGSEHAVSASMLTAGISSVGRADRWPVEWLVAARRSTLDLLEPVESGFGSPRFSDTLGRLRWSPSGAGVWTLGWLVLDDRLQLGVADDEEAALARYRDDYVWLAQEQRFGDLLRARSALVVTEAERSREGRLEIPDFASGRVSESSEFERWEFTSDWTFDRTKDSALSFGGAFSTTRSNLGYRRQARFAPDVAAAFARPARDDLEYRSVPSVRTGAVYVAQRRRWSKLDAELGLRLDAQVYDSRAERTQWSPRLNLRYDLTDRFRMYASAGRFTQAQQVEEWRAEEAQSAADPAQRALHSVVGLEYQSSSALRVGVEIYAKRWTEVSPYFDSRLDPLSLLPDLAVDRVRLAPKVSEAAGLELTVRSPLSDRLNGWGTLTWSRVADDFGGADVFRSWDQPLALSAGLSWKGSHASASAVLGWHRGWPRTPVSLASGAGPALTLGARNEDRWGDYYALDLRGAWTWRLASGGLTAYAEVTNATNRRNDCCVGLERAGDGLSALQAETDQWLPLILNLGMAFRWGATPQQ